MKYYAGEGSASFETVEKPVWRPKGRQLNQFRKMLLTDENKLLHITKVSSLSSSKLFSSSDPSHCIIFLWLGSYIANAAKAN